MPHQSKIDAPVALHHIIVRGIERCKIFKDDTDSDSFLERFEKKIRDDRTLCYSGH